jgi:isopenicillin-N N-acyltransferase like protein
VPAAGRAVSFYRRWLRRLLWTVLVTLLLIAGFLVWVYCACIAYPPRLSHRPAILAEQVTTSEDGIRRIGASWFLKRRGRSQLHLEGDPFTLGYANAALTADLLEIQERSLLSTVREHFPSRLAFSGVALAVLVNNRRLPDFVTQDLELEILGLSRGGPDPFPEYGPRYHRILNYHAAHDIAHWVWDRPVVGCTAFAVGGKRTVDGALIAARNFDFEAGRHFDENKIIGRYLPDRGHAFLSVAWPGMAGVVTGLNAQNIWCSINGAHSTDRDNIGTPVALVVRDVMQHASSLAEAVEIIRKAKVFVSDSYLVADGKTGVAVVVEKTPIHCAVRASAYDMILSTNHFESPEFVADAGNVEQQSCGTTTARRARLAELLSSNGGPLDPASAAAILRDRRAIGGKDLELGHRAAINGLIATHAVVADVTRGVLYVSRGPHSLGAFDAYSLESFAPVGGDDARAAIPPDSLLTDGGYEKWSQAAADITAATTEFRRDRSVRRATRDALNRARAILPHSFEALYLAGELAEADGDIAGARLEFERARDAVPAFRSQVDDVEAALNRLDARAER